LNPFEITCSSTVVHLEDYREDTIITDITEPDGTFSRYHGKMKLIP